jgi:hypothetical protein
VPARSDFSLLDVFDLSGDDLSGDDGDGEGVAGESLGVDDDFSDDDFSAADAGRSESDEGAGAASVLSGALPELPLRLSVL